jgi:hypothetical protein
MADQLTLLVAGFLLSGVLGGALGYLFQRRAWEHQHLVERRDVERRQALQVFEEVSSLLDKRLYRMRRVYWAARRRYEGEKPDQLSVALDDYRAVLVTWNDNLNRTLALVDTYFGGGVRKQLELEVYEQFAALGRALDDFVRKLSTEADENVQIPPLGRRLNTLSFLVYRLNIRMLRLLQEERLGQAAPPASASSSTGGSLLQFGQSGPAVRALQRGLRRAGETLPIDGGFGRQTEEALRAFQRSHALDVDGIAGPRTLSALPNHTAMPVLREGRRGDVVAELQTVLTEYATGRWETVPERVDGIFGADTTAAVEAFQRWHELIIDGVVGDETWASGLDSAGNTLENRVGLHHATT